MLYLGVPGVQSRWSTGVAACYVHHSAPPHVLIVSARCRFGSLFWNVDALLDTAASWSVISGDFASTLGSDVSEPIEVVERFWTRYGLQSGHLCRLKMSLVADQGQDLAVDATCLVINDWPGPVVLGYRGFLERVRIALDPGDHDQSPMIYFGPP